MAVVLALGAVILLAVYAVNDGKFSRLGKPKEETKFSVKYIFGLTNRETFTDIDVSIKDIIKIDGKMIPLEKITKLKTYIRHVLLDGVNIKSAIVGGLLAGGAGAVVGSSARHQKTKMINYLEIEYVDEHNEQKLFILCKNPNLSINGLVNFVDQIELNSKYYNIQNEIEHISYEESNLYRMSEDKTKHFNKENTSDILTQLFKLKEVGVLTEEEFETKKKEMLEKI